MSNYITRHVDPDFVVTHEAHETYAQAEEYAREVASEDGGEVGIFFLRHTVWAEDEQVTMDKYNGVRAGVDYPATL